MALQALWWESTSGHCPRCGEATARIEGEWGKKCPRCQYEHYPHLHPATIVLVRDGQRVLLTRKAGWAQNRYALVAGFVDNGESLEACVAREIKEEVGVDVQTSATSQPNGPSPRDDIVFSSPPAGGDVVIDTRSCRTARCSTGTLPGLPSRTHLALHLDHYGAVRSARAPRRHSGFAVSRRPRWASNRSHTHGADRPCPVAGDGDEETSSPNAVRRSSPASS